MVAYNYHNPIIITTVMSVHCMAALNGDSSSWIQSIDKPSHSDMVCIAMAFLYGLYGAPHRPCSQNTRIKIGKKKCSTAILIIVVVWLRRIQAINGCYLCTHVFNDCCPDKSSLITNLPSLLSFQRLTYRYITYDLYFL